MGTSDGPLRHEAVVAELRKLRKGHGLTPSRVRQSALLALLLGTNNPYEQLVMTIARLKDGIDSRSLRNAYALNMVDPKLVTARREDFARKVDRSSERIEDYENRAIEELAILILQGERTSHHHVAEPASLENLRNTFWENADKTPHAGTDRRYSISDSINIRHGQLTSWLRTEQGVHNNAHWEMSYNRSFQFADQPTIPIIFEHMSFEHWLPREYMIVMRFVQPEAPLVWRIEGVHHPHELVSNVGLQHEFVWPDGMLGDVHLEWYVTVVFENPLFMGYYGLTWSCENPHAT